MMSSVAKVIQPTATVSSVPVSGPSEFHSLQAKFKVCIYFQFIFSNWNSTIDIAGPSFKTGEFECDVERLKRRDDYSSSQYTTFIERTATPSEERSIRLCQLCPCSSTHPAQ